MFSAKAANGITVSTEINFSAQPQQCVTLHQGRDCFATILIQWQRPTSQTICLFHVNKKQATSKKQLMCWPESKAGQANIEFESSDNLTYQLRTQLDDRLLAETEIIVSWLHKNTRRRRWRLF